MFSLIGFLVFALVAAIVIYVIYLILGMINLPAPIKTIVYLIVALFILLWLLSATGIYPVSLGVVN